MSDRELLERLLSMFYVEYYDSLEYGYVEGTKVCDILGEDVEKQLKKIYKESDFCKEVL